MTRAGSASGPRPSQRAEGARVGRSGQADVAARAGGKDAGTATSPCRDRETAQPAPCCRRRGRPVLALPAACPPPPTWGLAPLAPCKQTAGLCAVQTRRRATQTPGQHGRVVLEPTGPGQDSAPGAARRRARRHHGRSHVSGEYGWVCTAPWGAGTCLAVDGPGAEAEELLVLDPAWGEVGGSTPPINTTIPKYDQTSPAPVPCPTADSWGSFQPHDQIHSSTSSCPVGPASFCTPSAQAGGVKAAACGIESPPGHAALGSAQATPGFSETPSSSRRGVGWGQGGGGGGAGGQCPDPAPLGCGCRREGASPKLGGCVLGGHTVCRGHRAWGDHRFWGLSVLGVPRSNGGSHTVMGVHMAWWGSVAWGITWGGHIALEATQLGEVAWHGEGSQCGGGQMRGSHGMGGDMVGGSRGGEGSHGVAGGVTPWQGAYLGSRPWLCHACPPPALGQPQGPPPQSLLPSWRPGELGVASLGCSASHPPVPKTLLLCCPGPPSQGLTLPTGPDPGTRLSLGLRPQPPPHACQAVCSAIPTCAQGGCCHVGGALGWGGDHRETPGSRTHG